MTGDVTVIIPVWNRSDLLESLLCKLRGQTYPIEEVLVVDDGSEDDSADFAEAMGARAIRMQAHGGFAKAVNRGIRESCTPLVAIMNNDVEPAPDWLQTLCAGLAPDAWFATGRILQAANPGLIDAAYDAVCRGGAACRLGNGRKDGPVFREPRRIWSTPFTAALFRVELFERIGLLDERFETYLEDVDFGLRCALAGCAGRYVPEAVAFHQGSSTLGRWHPDTTRLLARNQVFLVAKYYSRKLLIRYGWPIFAAQALWGLVALRHGVGLPWIEGKREGIRSFGEFRDNAYPDSMAQILHESEGEIRRIQRHAGTDFYWTLYFLLTAGGAK
jgi:GT2 family glycosyltransferase